jgi:predicted HTH transcriptional regulator
VGSAKREMAPDYLVRRFRQRSQARIIRFDEQPVPGATLDDLADELWQRFASPRVQDSREVLPQGDTAYQLDAQVLAACHFVRKNMQVYATKDEGRRDLPQYDMTAVFEALVNAVAHRDYSIHGAKIRLRMFADRLELYSPGAIPNTMTVESLPYRQAARNEAITSLLAKCAVPEADKAITGRSAMMDKRGEGGRSFWIRANDCPANDRFTGWWMTPSCCGSSRPQCHPAS